MKNYFLALGACILLGSCSTGDAAMSRMLGGSSQALTFLNCRATAQDEVEFVFSRPVTIQSLSFEPELQIESVEEGGTVRVKLAGNQEPGRLIKADIVAQDERRNSINVLISLRTRNDRMPQLVINEVCTEYASATAGKKAEFIEFKMKSAGNLGAMRVVIHGNSNAAKETIYEFSPAEVRRGDYIVLHMRTYDETSRNEYGSNLSESGGMNSSPNARDFWIPGTDKRIHKTSIIYVLDQDDNVLNALILSENDEASLAKDYLAQASAFLSEKNAWTSGAFITAGTTNTRTICRDETKENTNSAADWYVTATSGATPGRANDARRYSP
ncbi:MAG: hypothetical protein FWC01_09270 [Treponema sp.]|nr:hypothetical protein [Treponema sp.]MCL2238141.1 hypothetical protein [Treponema sp.]